MKQKFCSGSAGLVWQMDGHAFVLWESSAVRLRRLGLFYRRPRAQRTSGQTKTTDPMPWERGTAREGEMGRKYQEGLFRYGGDVLRSRNCPSDPSASLTTASGEWMNATSAWMGKGKGRTKIISHTIWAELQQIQSRCREWMRPRITLRLSASDAKGGIWLIYPFPKYECTVRGKLHNERLWLDLP